MEPPDDPSELTEEFRAQELERGRRSFAYFLTSICGLTAEDPDTGEPTLGAYHYDMCSFLEGRPPHFPYNRAVICAFRGGTKSVTVMMYILWRCLYIVNLSALILSNSSDNARDLHFLPLINILTSSRRAEYIRWLYQHRFPPNMAGTTTEHLILIRTDPLAEVTISYAGMESKLEGKHPSILWIDDPEGADAEKKKSTIPNEASYQLWQRVQFLPRYPVKAQIILTATPWGKKPLVWRLRDLINWQSEADNATSSIKFFWRPIRKNGKSLWPERFPDYLIDEMLKDPLARTQLLLERSQGDSGFFDMAAVTESFYQWLSPDKTAIVYKGYKFDLDKLTDQGFVKPELTESVVKMRQLRFFIHFDPLHRTDEIRRHSVTSTRPAKAGIVVVGVGPDAHAFVIDDWAEDADLYAQATELFRLYRMYCPSLVTFESIGAQVWLLSFVKSMEDQNPMWARPMSAGLFGEKPTRIPKLSLRLKEADKTTQSKEWLFREGLSPWLNHGALHLRSDQRGLYTELEAVLNENLAVDRVDCLAQGPSVWKPGMADTLAREWQARRQYVDSFVKKVGGAISHTGWRPSGWRKTG